MHLVVMCDHLVCYWFVSRGHHTFIYCCTETGGAFSLFSNIVHRSGVETLYEDLEALVLIVISLHDPNIFIVPRLMIIKHDVEVVDVIYCQLGQRRVGPQAVSFFSFLSRSIQVVCHNRF